MSKSNPVLKSFLADVKETQQVWALQDKLSEDWVVLDAINYENAEVMPLWSYKNLAEKHCTEEWQGYIPVAISLAEWFEFWVEDLVEDNVMIGVDWPEEGDYVELELADFTQSLSEVEKL